MGVGQKYDFCGENFCKLLTFAAPKDATPPNLAEKTFMNSHKSHEIREKLSPSKVSRYTVYDSLHSIVRPVKYVERDVMWVCVFIITNSC